MQIVTGSQTVAHNVTYSVLMKLAGEGIWQWDLSGKIILSEGEQKNAEGSITLSFKEYTPQEL